MPSQIFVNLGSASMGRFDQDQADGARAVEPPAFKVSPPT